MLLLMISTASISSNAQKYHIGNLVTDMQDMSVWSYSRVKLHLTMNTINFTENNDLPNKKILVSERAFQITYKFINEEPTEITYRLTEDEFGKALKEVYYSFLGIYAQNAFGQWLTQIGGITVFTSYSDEINGFIINSNYN